MATLGLELESRFKEVVFDDEQFTLFGREKSKKSISIKKKLHISDFNKKFKRALEKEDCYVPTKIRPLLDFYAFKLVCPNIEDPNSVIDKVLQDILDDIKNFSPSDYQDIIANVNNQNTLINLIDANFSKRYHGLKRRIDTIKVQSKEANAIQTFLDANSSIDFSSLTYKEYYQKITYCYTLLSKLAYETSFNELEYLDKKLEQIGQELEELRYAKKLELPIPEELQSEYSRHLNNLLDKVAAKRTNKLDLSVGDLMVFDVLTTSKALKDLGVKCSLDSSRTKEKRTENGYIANFYSFDMLNGLTSELQLQSKYRYEYGEHGPAAHASMDSGIKQRTLYQRPSDDKDYKEWEHKQFLALPRYFSYKGNGLVHVYNTLDNFKRYYDCEDEQEVKKYVQFISTHNVDLLYNKFLRFHLGDLPALEAFSEKKELTDEDAER